jgi:hypothetical protein
MRPWKALPLARAPSPASLADPETRRALELDAPSAIPPMDRRDRFAELLTDDDVDTLKHRAREGLGYNILRALTSDCLPRGLRHEPVPDRRTPVVLGGVESPGKRRSTRLRKGAPWLTTLLVQCA